jgi:hypothetical protein
MSLPHQSSMFLTPGQYGEVADLTGANQRSKQCAILARQGVPFVVANDGWPRVARGWLNKALETPKEPTRRSDDEPDFSSLKSGAG